jgi:hypothetical protein
MRSLSWRVLFFVCLPGMLVGGIVWLWCSLPRPAWRQKLPEENVRIAEHLVTEDGFATIDWRRIEEGERSSLQVRTWGWKSGRQTALLKLELMQTNESIEHLLVLPDRRTVWIKSAGESHYLADLETGRFKLGPFKGLSYVSNGSADGRWFTAVVYERKSLDPATGATHPAMEVRSAEDGRVVLNLEPDEISHIHSHSYADSGNRFIAVRRFPVKDSWTASYTLTVYDLLTGDRINQYTLPGGDHFYHSPVIRGARVSFMRLEMGEALQRAVYSIREFDLGDKIVELPADPLLKDRPFPDGMYHYMMHGESWVALRRHGIDDKKKRF